MRRLLVAIALLALTLPAIAAEMPAATRNGRDIYQAFHDGLADPSCDQDGSSARCASTAKLIPSSAASLSRLRWSDCIAPRSRKQRRDRLD